MYVSVHAHLLVGINLNDRFSVGYLGGTAITVRLTSKSSVSNFRSLLNVSERIRHVVPGSLVWSRHHGKTRLLDVMGLKKLDLVLTTYHTISAEWKHGKQANQSIIFSTRWKRLILDEGKHCT